MGEQDGKPISKLPTDVLREIRDELSEHLDALNRNTEEIQEAHEYVSELEAKLDKLAERVDALQSLLLAQTPAAKPVRLTPREEEIFVILLELTDPITSVALGKRCGLTGDLAAQTLFCLRQKGIPVLAQMLEDDTFYEIEPHYRETHKDHVAMRPVGLKSAQK